MKQYALLFTSLALLGIAGCSNEPAPSTGTDAATTPGNDGGTPGNDAATTPGNDSGAVIPEGETGSLVGITAAHNAARDRVGATPPIPHVEWSNDIAAVAQAWSEHLASTGCNLMHSSGSGYGENLFWITGSNATPTEVVDSWYSEVECYSFGTFMGTDSCSSECDRYGGCGHYTQVVWRETQRIGCGMAVCPSGAEIWTCNYDPPGNYLGEEPY